MKEEKRMEVGWFGLEREREVVVWTVGGGGFRVGRKGSYVGSHHEQENANQRAGVGGTGGLARELHGLSGRSLFPFWLDGWRESEGEESRMRRCKYRGESGEWRR